MWDPIWPQLTAACAAWCCSAPFVTELARSAARASAGQERFQKEDAPAFGRLDEISVPSVIMVGDLDHPALIDSNEQAAARIPGCTLIRMPGVDHYPTVRAPGLVLDTIRKYCPAPL
jgi:pimeloyl-ACP methyl ester carboxylesterase